ncbi:MAG: mechanosensitive ion channel family protein [Streptosporangiaceae bacterium]
MFLHAPLKGLDLPQAPDTLTSSCGHDPGIACRFVWDVSHSGMAARLTAVYLAGPANLVLRLAWLVFLALVARALVHRLINRVTSRAADAPLHSRLRRSGDAAPGRKRWRRGRSRFTTDSVPAGPSTAAAGPPPAAETATAAVHEAASERRHQRAHALGSILRSAASVTIFAIAVAIGLGDLGVNLAPVLASAGVVGIAVGFGAQNLVRDFLAGIFMLLEDQYGVGDVINIGDSTTGTVEAVSLRTTRLRDVNGVVWHLRNGALEKVGNESQGWARAVVDIPVPPELEIADTRTLMEHAAGSMWKDRRWRKLMLERPEVWGVQDISATQIVMRVVAKTLPLRQWEVGRELRERVLSAIDAATEEQAQPGPPAGQTLRRTATALAPGPAPSRTGAHKTAVRPRVRDVPPNGREASAPPETPVLNVAPETGENDRAEAEASRGVSPP